MNGKENKKNLLEKLYIEQELSTRDIANILNDLSNLVSLCRECHTFVHSNNNVNKIFIIEG